MLLDIQQREMGPDIDVFELTGKLALGRESQRIETLVEQIIAAGRRKAIVDLTKVDYIDSAGLGLLALCAGKLKESGGKLVIVAPEGRVLKLLQLTQINAIVEVMPTLAEAQQALNSDSREASA